jgi:hypothetical protein
VATVTGDYAPYTYSWSGTDSLSGTRSSVFKQYTEPGLKTATVTVKSTSNPNASSTVACSGAVSDGDDGDGGGDGDDDGDDDGGPGVFVIPSNPVLDPNLNCTVSMVPVASSTVKINTKTSWLVANTCPSCRKTWSINGDSSVQAGTGNTFENFFTTVGLKTVSVVVSSTTVSLVGNPCSATTTVNQTGSTSEF